MLLLLCLPCFTQAKGNTIYKSKSISGNYGLSQNSVHSIVRDHVGYIWLGTAHGLNRFDGNKLVKYFHNAEDAYSISSNNILLIYEDRDGNIWLSTPEGINRYDRKNDRFVRFVFSKTMGASCIYETADELWFPDTAWKFHVYNKKDKSYTTKEILAPNSGHSASIHINKILPFDQNNLLVATYSEGLFLMNKKTTKLTVFCPLPTSEKRGLVILDDFIYCATYTHVYQLSHKGEVIRTFNQDNSGLQSNIILDMEFNPQDSTLWVATDGAGIQMFDAFFKHVNSLQIGPKALDVLTDNSINDITIHRDGMVFLGTVRSGGLILYPSYFQQFPYANQSKYGPSNKTVLCIYEDDEANIWLGTDGGGLNRFDRERLTFDHFGVADGLKITSIVQFSTDFLLVGSYARGLLFFNKRTQRFSDAHQNPLFAKIRKNATHTLFRDSKGDIWISDGRLCKINRAEQKTQILSQTMGNFFQEMSPMFISAMENKEGVIWFSTYGGMYAYSVPQQKFTDRIPLSNTPPSFGRAVNAMVSDTAGNLVFGTDKGLLYYDLETKHISGYISNINYKNLMFQSLYFDGDHNLWIGSNEGVVRIIKKKEKENIFMFNTLDNKSSLEYFQGAILKSTDEKLYLGSNEGLTRFNPKNIKPHMDSPATVITSFYMLTSEKEGLKDSILSINVFKNDSIILDYSTASYQFNFNAFDIPFSETTQYAYQLYPFEKIWHTGKGNAAIYSNLSAGTYTFRVKAQNRNGIWNTDSTNIQLTILPPWWNTIWFKLLLLLFFMAIAYLVWRASLQRAKLRQEVAIKEREKERLNEINQMKLRFFTNISHELKTPLTLIYNPLDHLVKTGGSDSEFRTMLPFLYRNAHRMTLLIDQILDFRKSELSVLRLMVSKGDVVADCKQVLTYFEHQARIENVHLKFRSYPDCIEAWYDADMLFKIVSNLISNALKNTRANGSVLLSVIASESSVILEVEDTGSGIPADDLNLIFERYYQVGNSIKGTGIGLALTHRLVKLHHGQIKVSSRVGRGTTFTVTLPLGHSHFKKEDFVTKKTDRSLSPAPYNLAESFLDNSDTHDISILIVEDEWELREYIAKLLQNSFRIITAKNGREALDILQSKEPDLIITDVMMPHMDGIEFCKTLKSDLRISHIPVLMLTARTSVQSQIQGLKSGADAYMPKPFNTQLLFTQIKAILNNRQIVKERFSHDLGLKTDEVSQSAADEKFLHKAICIVEQNMEDPGFDVAAFVKQMAMSRTLVYNKIKAIAGKPIKDFIINIKLRKAAELLRKTDKPVSEISVLCGFADASYFSVVFKRHFKQSPTNYRNKV